MRHWDGVKGVRTVGVFLAAMVLLGGGFSSASHAVPPCKCTSGLVLSMDDRAQWMTVVGACGGVKTIRWNDATRIVSRKINPTIGELMPGATVSYEVDTDGMAHAITVRTQLDEAAWYTSMIARRFQIRPDYISRFHTRGKTFEDIWDEIASRCHVAPELLDKGLAETFGGDGHFGTGGVDQ